MTEMPKAKTQSVKRYEISIDYDEQDGSAFLDVNEENTGEWVRWEDVQEILALKPIIIVPRGVSMEMTDRKYYLGLRVKTVRPHEAENIIKVLEYFDTGFGRISDRDITYKITGRENGEVEIMACLTLKPTFEIRASGYEMLTRDKPNDPPSL